MKPASPECWLISNGDNVRYKHEVVLKTSKSRVSIKEKQTAETESENAINFCLSYWNKHLWLRIIKPFESFSREKRGKGQGKNEDRPLH